jgi:LysM repeat protein
MRPRDHAAMKAFLAFPMAGVVALLLLPGVAEACGERTMVSGETVAQIARRCGVNEQALRQVNPGLSDRTIRPGIAVNVPPRPLPSPQSTYGRSRVAAPPPAVSGPGIHVRVPRHAPPPPKRVTIERPLIGHMPSILEPPQ